MASNQVKIYGVNLSELLTYSIRFLHFRQPLIPFFEIIPGQVGKSVKIEPMEKQASFTKRFASFAWIVLAYNILVILWGAYVRASGSGAGCGAHWPLCNGEVLPRTPGLETLIEFAHRATSGLALVMVVSLFIWAWRAYPKGHSVRLGAAWSLFFIFTESLVGAMLVLFKWVALDQSVERVLAVSVHLINTFLLLAAITLTAWWASGGPALSRRANSLVFWALLPGWLGLIFIGTSGAITALGDTLFPAGSLVEGIRQDFLPTAHFLVRLRVYHPVIAILVGFYLAFVALLIGGFSERRITKRLAWGVTVLFVVQLIAGAVNLLLLAPIFMQMIHLLLADSVWIVFILLSASALAKTTPQAQELVT